MMNKNSFKGLLAIVGLLAVFGSQAGVALAGTSGDIAGIVTDAKTGAPVAGVHLKISSPSQTVNTTTDAHGRFIVFALQPDDYTLTADRQGYDPRSVSGFPVFADQTQQYDLTLTPSSEAQTSGTSY